MRSLLMLSRESFPQRRKSCRKGGALTPGARSCALPRPTFLRQRGLRKFGSLEAWKLGFWGGVSPHTLTSLLYKRPHGAKRRAAVAVSGEAAERPMEPEAVRASPCVFAVPFLREYCFVSNSVWRKSFREDASLVQLGHVADVPGVQGQLEVWKLGCLEVWFLCTTIVLSLFSVFCSLGRASAPSPAGAWGSAPHLQLSNLSIPFVSFVISKTHWQSCRR